MLRGLLTVVPSVWTLLIVGSAFRLALAVYGLWQDAVFPVKYTDIDYAVITDAAAALSHGGSPFDRATYRYTPLLAWVTLPNVWLHPAFGKLLFCVADIIAGWLISRLLRKEGATDHQISSSVAAWLFNPFTMTISTRGSGEALVVVQLLATLLLLRQGRVAAAAAVFGLAVHWRIYPAIYTLPIAISLINKAALFERKRNRSNGKGSHGMQSMASCLKFVFLSIWNKELLVFGAVSTATLIGLGVLFFCMYGHPFLHEAYLYHTVRRDPRHNFSPVYYSTFLAILDLSATTWLQRLVSASQLTAVVALGWRHASHLPSAWLLQTLAFVSLNKVVTAQYFVWYFSLLPLVLPRLLQSKQEAKRRLLLASASWLLAFAHWLGWAYLLEFGGMQVHLAVWGAGIIFLTANIGSICALNSSLLDCKPATATKAD